MDEIFNYLNGTFEAGQTVLDGHARIRGYANDGDSIDGLFVLGDEQISYQIDRSTTPGDTNKYTLTLERAGQTTIHEHLYAKEIIHIFKAGALLLLKP